MKKILILLLCAVVILCTFLLVLSDQNQTDKWCNTDQYGCWVTSDDGGKSYIYFWSEAARQYIMGDLTAPGSNVVDKYPGAPDYGEGKMPLMDNTTYLAGNSAGAVIDYDYITLTNLGVPFFDYWVNQYDTFSDYTAVYSTGNFTTTYTLWSNDWYDPVFPYVTSMCTNLVFSSGSSIVSNLNKLDTFITTYTTGNTVSTLSGYNLLLPSLSSPTALTVDSMSYMPVLTNTKKVAIGTH